MEIRPEDGQTFLLALSAIVSCPNSTRYALTTFERDGWVTRVWTYQELVNNNKVRFIAEGGSDAWADVEDLLRSVIYAMIDFKKSHGFDSVKMAALYPRLDSFDDFFVDWKVEGYLERSAYQVMSCMDRRDATRPEDFFYAMVGAITVSPAESQAPPPVHPAEHFMQICEAKGDSSFIYTTASRSEVPGRRWRPKAADRFQAVLPWHSHGEGQSGCVYPTHIQLNRMSRVSPGAITSTAKEHVGQWLRSTNTGSSAGNVQVRILRFLRRAGFSGCGEYLEMESGYFFPHSSLNQSGSIFVAVATGLRMTLGAPGLLLRQSGSGIDDCCGVGMFVGPVGESGGEINVG